RYVSDSAIICRFVLQSPRSRSRATQYLSTNRNKPRGWSVPSLQRIRGRADVGRPISTLRGRMFAAGERNAQFGASIAFARDGADMDRARRSDSEACPRQVEHESCAGGRGTGVKCAGAAAAGIKQTSPNNATCRFVACKCARTSMRVAELQHPGKILSMPK